MKNTILAFCLFCVPAISSAACILAGEFTGVSFLKGGDYQKADESFGDQIFRIETSVGSSAVSPSPSDLFCLKLSETAVWCDGDGNHSEVHFEIWAFDVSTKTVMFTANRITEDEDLNGSKMLKGKILGTCI